VDAAQLFTSPHRRLVAQVGETDAAFGISVPVIATHSVNVFRSERRKTYASEMRRVDKSQKKRNDQ